MAVEKNQTGEGNPHNVEGEAQRLYTQLETFRTTILEKAREAARISIPSLLPEDGHGNHTRFTYPNQSVLARGVRTLAAKLLIALFPPNTSFFRLGVPEKLIKEQTEEQGADQANELKQTIEDAFADLENIAMKELATKAIRSKISEIAKSLIVAGNRLVHFVEGAGLKTFRLDQYCVKRDKDGNLAAFAIKESVSYPTLPQEVKAAIELANPDETFEDGMDNTLELFTGCKLEDGKWRLFQDIKGVNIEKSRKIYKKDELPYRALRFNVVDGQDYGESLVMEVMGDAMTLEGLTRSISKGAMIAAKILFLNAPAGSTETQDLTDSESGDVIEGNAEDVSTLQANKFADFTFATNTKNSIEERLNAIFLITGGAVRNAERVTAEEIRILTEELETALGGIYSLLAEDFQLPFVHHLIHNLGVEGVIEDLELTDIQPVITTGLEALGRSHDLRKLDSLVAGTAELYGQQELKYHLPAGEYIRRRATALNIPVKGLLTPPEEVQAIKQQEMQAAMLEKATTPAIAAGGRMAENVQNFSREDEIAESA